MIYNTVTNQLYDGQKGISVVHVFINLSILNGETEVKDGSSAPVNIYPADSDIMSKTTETIRR